MQSRHVRFGGSLLAAALLFAGLLLVAMNGTTWAAPGAQGTVPTPKATKPKPTGQATAKPTNDNGGGGNDNGGNDNGGNDNGGGDNGGGAAPTAAPSVPGQGSVCPIGDAGAQCTADNLIILVPTGAAPAGGALTLEGNLAQPPCPPTPEGQVFLNHCFKYTWLGADAQPLSTLGGPVQFCFVYTAQDMAAASNRPESFLIGFAGVDGSWSLVKPTLDKENSRVCATTNQLYVWHALFSPQPTLLPATGDTPVMQMGLVTLAAALTFGGAVMYGVARKKRSR